jgi:hypothetical protein
MKHYQSQIGEIYVWTRNKATEMRIDDEGMDPEFDIEGLRALKAKLQAERAG